MHSHRAYVFNAHKYKATRFLGLEIIIDKTGTSKIMKNNIRITETEKITIIALLTVLKLNKSTREVRALYWYLLLTWIILNTLNARHSRIWKHPAYRHKDTSQIKIWNKKHRHVTIKIFTAKKSQKINFYE